MSTTEPITAVAETLPEPWDALPTAPPFAVAPPTAASIVPRDTIASSSLTAVIAIMTFLAAITIGVALLVMSTATDWQSDVGREVTIQVRPATGRDLDADVAKAVAVARAANGIADVRAFSKEESEKLVEPWLGTGLPLDELPIPRLIVVKLSSGAAPDFAGLRAALVGVVPSASLDDHRGFIERMRTMAGAAIVCGLAVLGLVLAVTALSIVFATRGAMATNRPTVEVLHYVGATDGFVAGQFQRHFLLLGFKGGAIGGGAAILLFGCVEAARAWFARSPGGEEASLLFGSLSIGVKGYLAIVALIVVMAVLTALVSGYTVNRTLESIE
jgi:cell division transport system permease protein